MYTVTGFVLAIPILPLIFSVVGYFLLKYYFPKIWNKLIVRRIVQITISVLVVLSIPLLYLTALFLVFAFTYNGSF